MGTERLKVTVPRETISFPSVCSNCLGKTDLTSYISKKEESDIEGGTKIKRRASFSIPICRPCEKTLIKTTRIYSAVALFIGTPIIWGLYFFIYGYLGLGEILGHLADIANFPLPLELFILILLICLPLYFLYLIIRPRGGVDWPVKLESVHAYGEATFSFGNEAYTKLFLAANPKSRCKQLGFGYLPS